MGNPSKNGPSLQVKHLQGHYLCLKPVHGHGHFTRGSTAKKLNIPESILFFLNAIKQLHIPLHRMLIVPLGASKGHIGLVIIKP